MNRIALKKREGNKRWETRSRVRARKGGGSLSHRNGAAGFIDRLDGLELLAHYVTGPLVPKTRDKYCPSHA